DLEAERLLVTVNEPPLTYDDLHSRRSRVEPGFTSDYGQQHVVLTVEPLIPDEARRMWEDEFGLHADDPMLEHCLQLAYAMSGGLPTAFAKAAREAQAGLAQTVPQYRERLRAELRLGSPGQSDTTRRSTNPKPPLGPPHSRGRPHVAAP